MASDARKILLVEDEKAIRDAVAAYLEREGYWVVGVGDGQSAVEEFEKHQFDLIVLDLMLPKLSGERVCRAIRDTSDVPIIMLTAKGEVEDRIIGLELGADDYIIKPFDSKELVARVKAHLAQYQRLKPQPSGGQKRLTVGALTADPEQRLIFKNGRELALKNKEYELLLFLMRHPGQVFSREDLYEMIWGLESMGDNVTVAVHVNRLREKIERDSAGPEFILTKWGVGYYFTDKD